ncbi:hypothetical protein DRJ22_00430 [Candidatus Woesearchaeota archaeon]|nr:MAG: hypothetical protein B6U93_00325 [Candidatus Woesearchaeota archaeon ex4484_78]RLE47021.1 MAG: hypothetical protein DRJ22_00430 [Candidatus Woesearchaeota archaeon]
MTEFKPEYLDFATKSILNLKKKIEKPLGTATNWSAYYITNIRKKLIKSIRIEGTDDDDEYRKAVKLYKIKKLDKLFDKIVLLEEQEEFDKIEKIKPKILKRLDWLNKKIEKIRKKIKNIF